MKDLKISVNKETRYVNLAKTVIGVDGENLQEKIVFSFEDEFVDGTARLEYENIDGKQYVLLEKENETYTIPVKSVITKKGNIKMQLVITEGTDEENIPVFKSNQFYLWCEEAINAVKEAPDSYELWIETANEKLTEIDNVDIDLVEEEKETKIKITRKDGTTKETTIAGGDKATNNYEQLNNLPKINGVELIGDKTSGNLKIKNIAIKYIENFEENKIYLNELEPGEYYFKETLLNANVFYDREKEGIRLDRIIFCNIHIYHNSQEELADGEPLMSCVALNSGILEHIIIYKDNVKNSMLNKKRNNYTGLALNGTDQSITGLKTFLKLPETEIEPTKDAQLVNKAYVDNSIDEKITSVLEEDY